MDLVARYLKDVERLKEALLASPVGERVAKIYLFGGVARGAVTEQSDIDVLIVLRNGREAAEQVADVLLSLQMEGCGPLEPLTCSVEDLIAPKDYFLYAVTRRGKEIYSMPEEEIRREGAWRLRDLAVQYLEAAEDTLGRGHLRLALDGAYNAAELAVKGLLLLIGVEELPGSHGGLLQLFGERWVKPGLVEREVGRELNRALEWRNWARYRYEARLSDEEARAVINLARNLIDRLSAYLARPQGS